MIILLWLKDFFIYSSITLGITIFILIIIIMRKVFKDIKKMDKNKRRSLVENIRKMSKHTNQRKRLKF